MSGAQSGDYHFRGVGRLTAEQRTEIADTWQEEMYGKLPRGREYPD